MSNLKPRISRAAFRKLAPEIATHLAGLGEVVANSSLDPSLVELVKIRVSQINGCAFCIQYHLTAARALKVAREKLDLVVTWEDAPVFSDRERAALAWAEALTDVGLGVSEDDFDDVRAFFSEGELAHLSAAIATVNAWNRIAIGFRFTPEPPGPRAVET